MDLPLHLVQRNRNRASSGVALARPLDVLSWGGVRGLCSSRGRWVCQAWWTRTVEPGYYLNEISLDSHRGAIEDLLEQVVGPNAAAPAPADGMPASF